MKANYPQMQKWIGLSEGGYVNHPKDPGGATDRGITQRTFDAWNRSQGRPPQPVKGIPKAVAEMIIERNYFDKVGADELPSGLDYCMADYAVNSGVSRAAKELQRVLGVKADGVVGVQTLAAAWDADVRATIVAVCERRMAFLRGLHHWGSFKTGWTRRVMGDDPGVQAGDIGVIDRAVKLAYGSTKIQPPVVVAPGKAPEPDERVSTLAKVLRTISGVRE